MTNAATVTTTENQPNAASAASTTTPGAAAAANNAWYGEIAADRPQEFRDWVGNKQFPSPQEALWSQYNLEKLVGHEKAGRTLVLPKDDKDEEGIKAFRAKLGVPDSPDKYELPVAQGTEKDPASQKFRTAAAGWLHSANVPKAEAQKLVAQFDNYFAAEVAAQHEQAQTASQAELTKLQAEWGGKAAENTELARRFLKTAGWDDAKITTYEQTFGTASMLKDFYRIGSMMGEHGFAQGEGNKGGGMSLAQAKEKVEELRAQRASGQITDKQWAHGQADGKHAEYVRANELVQRFTTGT